MSELLKLMQSAALYCFVHCVITNILRFYDSQNVKRNHFFVLRIIYLSYFSKMLYYAIMKRKVKRVVFMSRTCFIR